MIFHLQALHAIWFFSLQSKYNILQIINIWDPAFFATTCTCWIYDLNDVACTVDRYDLKYKPLFIEVSQTKILKIVKHSFSSLFVQTVLAPYTVLTHAEGFSKNSFSSAVSVPFLCLLW